MTAEPTAGWTDDRLLGGKLVLRQPRHGYRIAVDALMLAGAATPVRGGWVVDVGAGVGAVALALALRCDGAPQVLALERDPHLVRLLHANIARNGLGDRVHAVAGDLSRSPLAAGSAALVVTNPPYESGRGTRPASVLGRLARWEGALDLAGWLAACAALTRPGGDLVVVHRADRLADLLARPPGAASVLPLWPRAGIAAKRVLVRYRVGRGGATKLLAGLVLHEPEGHFTAEAEAILRGEGALNWE